MRPSRRRELEGYVTDSGIERVLSQLSSAVVGHTPADALAAVRFATGDALLARDGITSVALAPPLLTPTAPSDSSGDAALELAVRTPFCEQRAAVHLPGADVAAVEAACASLDAALHGLDPRDQAACDAAIRCALADGGGGAPAPLLPPPAAQSLAIAASLLVAAAGAAPGDTGGGPASTVAGHVTRLVRAAPAAGGGPAARKPPSAVSGLPKAVAATAELPPAVATCNPCPQRVSFALLAGNGVSLTLRELGITLPLPAGGDGGSAEWVAVWRAAKAAHAALGASLSAAVSEAAGSAGGKPLPMMSAAPKKPTSGSAAVPPAAAAALAIAPSGALVWPAELPVSQSASSAAAAATKHQPAAVPAVGATTTAKGKVCSVATSAAAPGTAAAAPPPPPLQPSASVDEPPRSDAADAPQLLPPLAWTQALAAVRAAVAAAGAPSAGVYVDVGTDAPRLVAPPQPPLAATDGATDDARATVRYRVAPDAPVAPAPPVAAAAGKGKPAAPPPEPVPLPPSQPVPATVVSPQQLADLLRQLAAPAPHDGAAAAPVMLLLNTVEGSSGDATTAAAGDWQTLGAGATVTAPLVLSLGGGQGVGDIGALVSDVVTAAAAAAAAAVGGGRPLAYCCHHRDASTAPPPPPPDALLAALEAGLAAGAGASDVLVPSPGHPAAAALYRGLAAVTPAVR